MSGKDIIIDKTKCDGCGLCVKACHEGALAIVDGKAELVRKDFCDGLGDCLPACPQGAISFDEAPVMPGINMIQSSGMGPIDASQWPIQLALVPTRSPRFEGSIVFAADCTAFVMNDFKGVLDGRSVIIGCPKLDDRSRFDKVLDIIHDNPVNHVVVLRMEVPCCHALTNIVRSAVERCGRDVTIEEIVVSRSGSVI